VGLQPDQALLYNAHDEDNPLPLDDQLHLSLMTAEIVHGQALLIKPNKRRQQVGACWHYFTL
jgi:hypothetical protein